MIFNTKSILLLLALFGFALSQSALVYKEIPASTYSRDPLIPTTRNFGIQKVINNAISSKKVANTTFTIQKVAHIYNATNSSYVNYKYDLSLKNSKGDIIATVFTVQYNLKSKRNLVISLGYNVTYGNSSSTSNTTNSTSPTSPVSPTSPTSVNFKEIPRSAYQKDSLIPITQKYGVAAIVQNAISTKRVNNSTFTVKAINHIYNTIDGNYVDYKFNLSLSNSAGDIISAIFTVQYQSDTKKNFLLSQSYKVAYGPKSSSPANTITNAVSENTTTNEISADTATNATSANPTTNVTSANNITNATSASNTTNATSSNIYTQIPASDFNQTLLQSLANYGTQFVIKKAIAQGKLPAGQYTVTTIFSISKQTLASNTNYQFNLEFANSDESRIAETNFTIKYKPSSGNKSIITYGYNVLPYATL